MQKFYKPSRVAVIIIIICLITAIYMTTLYKLQIYDTGADQDAAFAGDTTTQTITMTADRGDILDRNGNVLVSTRAAYNITLSRETLLGRDDINDIILRLIYAAFDYNISYTDTFPVTTGAPFTYVSNMTDSQKANLKYYIDYFKDDLSENISASDLIIWMKQHYGLDYTTNIADARLIIGIRYEMELRAIKSMNTYVFADDVGIDVITMLREHQQEFPGVNIDTSAQRVYHTKYAAHLLGYIGKMTQEDYADKYKALGYAYGSMIGKSGAELAFEQYLHGTDGTQAITKSDDGTVLDVSMTNEPVPGENVFLTIDIGLQAVAEDSLAAKIDLINAGRTVEDRVTGGAVVVTNVHTGEVLASCSYPTYDPATLSDNITDLLNNESQPLYNRATMGTYNPGSTFKMVSALAGLKSGKITGSTTVFDSGKFTKYPDYQPVCWIYNSTGAGHGLENVVTALRDSCNYFFYWLGDTIGIDAISATASDFGLGAKTGIELPEKIGTVATPENKKELLNDNWYASDNMISAIGQDINYFTPVQLSKYVSTIANGGTKYPLTILANVRSADFSSVIYTPQRYSEGTVTGSEYIPYLQEGMKLVASEGTASSVFKSYSVKVAAKTGTVQTGGNNAKLNDGIFVCYAPADNPEIAISLVVEKGTSGSTIMQIAKDVMDYYFKKDTQVTVARDNTILP